MGGTSQSGTSAAVFGSWAPGGAGSVVTAEFTGAVATAVTFTSS